MATSVPVTLDTPIVVKILFRGQTKRFKLPLKDLGAHVLPNKLRTILGIATSQEVIFERYSDSAATYVTLNTDQPQVYKTLFRAAKAKLKLRLKASVPGEVWVTPSPPPPASAPAQDQPLSLLPLQRMSSDTLIPQSGALTPATLGQLPNAAAPAPAPKLEPISPMSPTKSVDAEGEAPVPRTFNVKATHGDFKIPTLSTGADLAFRPKPPSACTTWVVYCNHCNHPMEDEHFHCSICDGGDYDLCPSCVNASVHCPGKGHWMVRRFVKDGCVINSTTQRLPPKAKSEKPQEDPAASAEEKASAALDEEPTRTCNCCVNILPEKDFVTCDACDDYDLCLECHMSNRHGHHPGHLFKPAIPTTVLPPLADFLCKSGRNVRHAAVCDGCDKFIYGVRHKCLNCPDWDYCADCFKNAKTMHPRHRFVPVYEALDGPLNSTIRHHGIYCDGPLCNNKENLSYIEGARFKCAVCHDTDFCQNCEAHPNNTHNHTHPLIRFNTPVRSVCVTTVNDGKMTACLGDRVAYRRSAATETTPVAPSANAATQVHTVVDLKPCAEVQVKKEKIAIRDLLADPVEPVQNKTLLTTTHMSSKPVGMPIFRSETISQGLDGHFVRDTIVDGSKIYSGFQFIQIWTMRNPGPNVWPAGCSVRHVGGDNMLNIDNTRPLSHVEFAQASESNILDYPVEVGDEVSFRVVMRAPRREGTAISYWRLKTADGMPFGHRLWCDIRVVSPPTPIAPISAPATLPPVPTLIPQPLYERLLHDRLERLKLARSVALKTNEKWDTNPHLSDQPNRSGSEQLARLYEPSRYVPEHRKKASHEKSGKVQAQEFMENRRKEHELALASIKSQECTSIKYKECTPETAVAMPNPDQLGPCKIAPEPQSSGMVFPRLDKESPESSTYQSTTAQAGSEKSSVGRTLTFVSDEEFFEDAESIALHSDEAGFMTDEEYDILDVSDEEIV